MDIFFFITIGIVSRLVPHLPNMTAVGALALFTGSTQSIKKSFLITFCIMLVSDIVLGFHQVMWATYGSLGITVLLGKILGKQRAWKRVGIFTLLSTLQFFVFTNFAVWLTGLWYPKTIAGLVECYIMALPFLRNSFIGDLFFTFVFFASYEIVLKTCHTFRMKYLLGKI